MLRFIKHTKGASAYNMAVDEALLRLCVSKPVLRIYGWQEPAVSMGYFQSIQVVPAHRPFVRRLTGGGLVDHAQDFTYTLIWPRQHELAKKGTTESYRLIHESIQSALSNYGLITDLVPTPSEEDSPDCFQKPVKFDLVDKKGKKIAGAAQRRTQTAVLHQGSLLIEALTNDFLTHFLAEMEKLFQEPITTSDLTSEELALAKQLEVERYSLASWNESR